ncbi:MAG: GNAT family N-acetyltransferase [Planctomycetota bacterium]|jgi:GNAT superfamily N-acetyltransferase
MRREIRDLYDKEVRRQAPKKNAENRWEWDDNVFRIVGRGPNAHENAVLCADCDEANIDATIARQVAFFGNRKHAFEWKLHDYDQPADLPNRLERAGFQSDPTETLVVFDLSRPFAARSLPDGLALEEITDREKFGEITPLFASVYGEDAHGEWLTKALSDEHLVDPAALRMFFIRADKLLVSAGWLRLPPGSSFASLWGGATHPDYRERGCYTALAAARLDAAREAGFRYVTVDCSENSRPILERRGFEALAVVTPWIWRP